MNPENFSLEELLLAEQSRANTDMLVDILRQNPAAFPHFWEIFMKNSDPVSRRAAWVIDCFTETMPDYINSRVEELCINLPVFKTDGLKRHSMRMLARSPLPEENLGILIDVSFRWLESRTESVAVKMYCILLLERISALYPEIKPELRDLIEIQMNEATPGFINISKKVLKRLK